MKKIVLFLLMLFCVLLVDCRHKPDEAHQISEMYMTHDSTFIFTFDYNSLYIDTIGDYIGMGLYYFNNDDTNGLYIIEDKTEVNGEVIYTLTKYETHDTMVIGLKPNLRGNHWSYLLRIDDNEPVNVNKVN